MALLGRLLLPFRVRRLRRVLPPGQADEWLKHDHNRTFMILFGYKTALEIAIRDVRDQEIYTSFENSVRNLRSLRSMVARGRPDALRVCS